MKPAKKLVREFCSIVTSGGTPSSGNAAYYGGEIPWLRTQEVTFNRIRNTEISISEAGLKNSAAKWIPENSVIVAMYGASAGRVAVNTIPLTTNQACCNLIINADSDFRFVYYALANSFEALAGSAKGAAQNNLNAGQVKEFEIPWFPIERQEAIADRLWQIDDLIENNRRRIKLLEEAARLIYREWFVRLRFPRHEHTNIENGIPHGWEKLPICSLCETIGGGTPSTKIPEYWDGDIPWVVPSDVTKNSQLFLPDTARKITEAGLRASSAKMLPANSILMSSRASVGYFALVDKPVCTNQGFISIVPHRDSLRLYLLFTLMSRVEEIRSLAGGTTFPEISKSKFREIQLVVPTEVHLMEFQEIIGPIVDQIRVLSLQRLGLVRSRDLLIPRLMSGEIEI